MGNKIGNLKIHTEYSLLEGVGKIDEYIKKAKEIGVNVLGIVDTSMFGTIEFYKKCKKENIKSIIGLEIFLDGFIFEGEYSLTLIAKNEIGYKNLLQLSTLSYSRFSRKRNKLKYDELKKYSEGLYIFSGGIHSECIKGLEDYKYGEVKKILQKLYEDFGNDFYVEIPAIKRLGKSRIYLKEILEDLNIKYVITNDIYYANKGEAILQQIMLSIKEGNKIEEKKEILYDDLYMKGWDEIKLEFSNLDDTFYSKAIENMEEIILNCNIDFEFNKFKFPKYKLPEGETEENYIRKLVYEGIFFKYLNKKVGYKKEIEKSLCEELKNNNMEHIIERVEYELSIINNMGYNGYFIIVWDFIKFAKENGIFVGPGRGSAAGSIVSYALNIIEIDPLKYNLIFERFLNPERISMPDIDIDFDQEQREMVIDYVLEKYGREYVAHIITFGTLKARAAIRDVGRVLNIDLRKVDKVAKLIPHNMELEEGIENIKQLNEIYKSDEEIKKMINYAIKIEGRVRHASIHAAGLVISKNKLVEEVPLYSDGKTQMVSTQYQMKELEDLGILKIDFLGLKNLTVLRKTIENIEKNQNIKIKLNDISLDDKKTYELMTAGNTLGIFQCESYGIRQLMKKVKIEKFDDIIALLALYRPGPLRSGMVDDFINSKNNKAEIKYPDESLKEILKETYGVILYQEQIMKIVNKMANYTLAEADELRRAIGKKIPEIIEKNREKFVKKSIENGVNGKKANEIYNLVDKFSGYGFNKSHSAAYALIAYWTAYFKANYKLEFFTAIMTTEMYNIDRLSLFINEARESNIEILVPDVNSSSYDFTIENNKIRFGMAAIKGVGINLVKEIMDERKENVITEGPFKNYSDFVYRMKQRGMNKKHLESLILSGSLDTLKGNRKEKFNGIEDILKWAQKKYEADEAVAVALFSQKLIEVEDFYMEKYDEYEEQVLLKYEKEYLGIYVSNHPLNKYKGLMEIIEHKKISELESSRNRLRMNKGIRIAGIIKNINNIITKAGEPMVKFQLEDFTGVVDVICFPNDYIKFGYKILENKVVIVEGTINEDGTKYSLFLTFINEINNLEENKNFRLYLLIDEESKKKTDDIKKLIVQNKGNNSVYFAMNINKKQEIIKLKEKYNINISMNFIRKIVKLIGIKKVKIK